MNIRIIKILNLFVLVFLVGPSGFAQQEKVSVYPTPQQIQVEPSRFVEVTALDVNGSMAADIKASLAAVFPGSPGKNRMRLDVKRFPSANFVSGAYTLHIKNDGIQIQSNDDAGVFYAVQTLFQLRQHAPGSDIRLPILAIQDYPDVAVRGTVEGFYGEPWTHADRLSQFLFYGQMKLNTYIYGPKDDPYHSSPNWRIPYPEKEVALIKELVAKSRESRVDFVWAIHPGKDIKWNSADRDALLKKFEVMYNLGVRAFAVFFDDISGDGTDAHKQAALLNAIHREFIMKKKDLKPLIMCPTEYNKGWSNPKPGTYLDILGNELDPAIAVMWTGNNVIADNTKEGLTWVNKRIKRPAFVWWNFPVSDYVRDHLLMGASYGLESDVKNDMSGFVANPMDKAEASKIALFGVADYAWNLKQYNYQESWEAANRWLMPEAPVAFRLFNSHNSDLGPNGHGYRRAESEEITPALTAYLATFRTGGFDTLAAKQIADEFTAISNASNEIELRSQNKRLIEQIKPWLKQFTYLGNTGSAVMQAAAYWNQGAFPSSWDQYLKAEAQLDSMAVVDQTYNQNPYQPGVKAGSLCLTPFVKEVFHEVAKRFEATKKNSDGDKYASGAEQTALLTNSMQLASQPLQLTNTSISISPILEVLKLEPGAYFGIRLHPNLNITAFNFNLEANNLSAWGRFEISADGINWKPLNITEKRGKGEFKEFDRSISYLRFVNHTEQMHSIYFRTFSLKVKPAGSSDQSGFAVDGSVNTFQYFSKGKDLEVNLPQHLQKMDLTILLRSNNAPFRIYIKSKAGKETTVYQGDGRYVQIIDKRLRKASKLYFNTEHTETIRIYEMKPMK